MRAHSSPPAHYVKLRRSFFRRPPLRVARDLLGLYFFRRTARSLLVGRIVEVEAYGGKDDPASHAYRGETNRNAAMFLEGGHLYVYFTYGMHFCANVVTGKAGEGSAVLIRAVEPIAPINSLVRNRMRKRERRTSERSLRRTPQAVDLRLLSSGPARFSEAFRIGRSDNGKDLCGSEIWLARSTRRGRKLKVERSPRVGVTQGKHRRWRFSIAGNPFVSGVHSSGSRRKAGQHIRAVWLSGARHE